jgi:hypothetical protein
VDHVGRFADFGPLCAERRLMFKFMLASTAVATLLLAGCPEREVVRVDERRPVVVERRDGDHHEEHREEDNHR